MYPAASRMLAMMPIVFCASLAPWLRLKNAADSSCNRRKEPSTRLGRIRRNNHKMAVISPKPAARPMTGERKMKMIVLVQPDGMIATKPAFATAAPA